MGQMVARMNGGENSVVYEISKLVQVLVKTISDKYDICDLYTFFIL